MRPVDTTAGTLTAALYESYGGRVHRLCARRLGEDEAPDAVQDTFLRVWLALRDGVEIRHPLPWLLTIADNVCVSRFRARSARVVTTELPDTASVEPSASSGVVDGLTTALRELPESQREALLRRELQGLSYDEIGAELGVSRASVAALVHRARRAVAESLRAARRGLPAFVPLPWVFRVSQVGHAGGGVTAAASAAAVTVAVAQLAGPPPLATADTPASHAPRIEVSVAHRSTLRATRRIGPSGVHHVRGPVVIPTTGAQPRAQHDPRRGLPEGGPDVPTWVPPLPRTDGQVPTQPPPREGPPPTQPTPGSPPEEGSPTPTAPTPASPPEADQPEDAAGEGSEAETGEPGESASGSSEGEPKDGGSHGHSDSAAAHGGQPPGLDGSGPPGEASAGSGNGNGDGGAPGSPQHAHAEDGGNGQLAPPGNGNPGGGSPSPAGSEQYGPPEKGSGSGQPQGGGHGEGPSPGSKR